MRLSSKPEDPLVSYGNRLAHRRPAHSSLPGTVSPTVTIDGTTNSTAPATDTVNLICYQTEPPRSNVYTHVNEAVIAEEVPLDSEGSFSWTGTPPPEGSCLLRAVPTGWGTSRPLTGFSALPVHLDDVNVKLAGGEGSPAIDFSANGTGVYDEADFSSAGDCGLSDFIPIHPDNDSYDTYPSWNCPTEALDREDGSGQRTDVLVRWQGRLPVMGGLSATSTAAHRRATRRSSSTACRTRRASPKSDTTRRCCSSTSARSPLQARRRFSSPM